MISQNMFKAVKACAFASLLPSLLLSSTQVQAQLGEAPKRLIAITHSATEVRLSWLAPEESSDIKGYQIFRDGQPLAQTSETFFIDASAQPNTRHNYSVQAFDQDNNTGEISNTDSVRTLSNNNNDGMRNGSASTGGQISLQETCGSRSIDNVLVDNLDGCLSAVIEQRSLQSSLGDTRAYVARLRRQEDTAMINLGMKLFHSKSLSQNDDTSCSSCHHPALSCGGDDLSMPIGVNASIPDLLGLGRTDGNTMPLVGRHAPHICNSALWTNSMFWDQRIRLRQDNRNIPQGQVTTADIRTPERDVTRIVNQDINSTDPLRLLIAQAHFPVTATAEMGDSSDFASNQEYREHIASKLQPLWGDEFAAAFGSDEVNFTRIAQAIAAYEASFLFINNPFFDYIDGNSNSLTNDAKRGAVLFYTQAGCSGCHSGTFFSQERVRGPLYPQIGVNGANDGNEQGHFRIPSLLNVEITAPYGDKGVFQTLERVIQHYSDVNQSLSDFYANNETCSLPQFQHLTEEECRDIARDGEARVLALLSQQQPLQPGENRRRPVPPQGNDGPRGQGNPDDQNPPQGPDGQPGPDSLDPQLADQDGQRDQNIRRRFSQQEISYLAAFLRSLTDKEAKAGSNEIQALTPVRDGGPDGNQLDAIDRDGNAL
ncbi:cytochrome-c peroxidase [Oceanospirillum beijerinckii]|uniref:cytochrome-c peroxidase n=1 Tax=Oceanospirillum beijerinckii TaxID=64976 RepID=UPI0004019E12|nr:cytochrome c peroxidase [Oceanospirillum beijerinckii]